MRAGAWAALAVAVLLASAAGPAGAQQTSTAELAERALADPAALDELRDQSEAAELALTGSDADVRLRLETLAADAEAAPLGSGGTEVDEALEEVFDQPRFQETDPNSLRARFERWRQEMLLRVASFLDRLISGVPGGPRAFFTLLALGAVAVLGLIAFRLAQRRLRDVDRRELARRRSQSGLDPAELRRLADTAAAEGRYGEAVRYLYQAGLVTLGERGRVELATGTTSAQVADQLVSADFDAVWHDFDEVTYGNRAATLDDLDEARRSWSRVLEGS